MSKLKIFSIKKVRKVRKDKGLGRLTSTTYDGNGKKVSVVSKLYDPEDPSNFITLTKKYFN